MTEDKVRRIVLETLRELLTGAMTLAVFKDGDGDVVRIKYVDEDFAEHVRHQLDMIEEKANSREPCAVCQGSGMINGGLGPLFPCQMCNGIGLKQCKPKSE